MAKAIPVILDTRSFKSKGDAIKFFQDMLNRYEVGAKVSHEDGRDLESLLKNHTEYAEKVGCGISHFEVRNGDTWQGDFKTKCFWIVRNDDTASDFSFRHCLTPKKD